jgi:hypothetical protein
MIWFNGVSVFCVRCIDIANFSQDILLLSKSLANFSQNKMFISKRLANISNNDMIISKSRTNVRRNVASLRMNQASLNHDLCVRKTSHMFGRTYLCSEYSGPCSGDFYKA